MLVSRISLGFGLQWGLQHAEVQTLGEFRGKDPTPLNRS